ncbi:sensor histidine kinase [Mucilaginibacter sp. SP1R1]|uniref:sensor histidine kinase n=1 Tax=Mucilaginibacter sp. SP1R1 TaxID=2723091 RepID=UPI00160C91E6|nr:HAMP domain-containing sensor histidine kinase [Mucilaginibacter sp. SP1R1]MBB6149370.1 signal transduction histidine kinase [Mucilaginibacter sp. SP1R1]
MKLLTKTSLHYLCASLALLTIFGGLLFYLLKKDISAEIQEQLELQVDMISAEIRQGATIHYPLVDIVKTSKISPARFRDTLIYDHYQQLTEGYYALTETKQVKDEIYSITVLTAYIGWDEYSKTISYIFLGLGVLLAASGLVVNLLISRKIWRPFLMNLAVLKKHALSSKEELVLTGSDTDEFEDLKTVLLDFTLRAKKEYLGLQEFTENSSHELQTPISIIRARLENLGQTTLNEQSARYLKDAREALERLSKVNKSLLLLAKLSGEHFPDVQAISLSVLLTEQLQQLEELYESRKIDLKIHIEPCFIRASPHLVDIMLSNMLANQLKHSAVGAAISVKLNDSLIEFSNEGEPLPFAESDLFTRFVKGDQGKAGIGLGLSIVKKICLVHHWSIEYTYDKGIHLFQVRF